MEGKETWTNLCIQWDGKGTHLTWLPEGFWTLITMKAKYELNV